MATPPVEEENFTYTKVKTLISPKTVQQVIQGGPNSVFKDPIRVEDLIRDRDSAVRAIFTVLWIIC
jgi:hypothetical protein